MEQALQGMFEGNGNAVICIHCDWQGWHHYTKFEGRKKKRGIKQIDGQFKKARIVKKGPLMTYADFEQAVPVKSR